MVLSILDGAKDTSRIYEASHRTVVDLFLVFEASSVFRLIGTGRNLEEAILCQLEQHKKRHSLKAAGPIWGNVSDRTWIFRKKCSAMNRGNGNHSFLPVVGSWPTILKENPGKSWLVFCTSFQSVKKKKKNCTFVCVATGPWNNKAKKMFNFCTHTKHKWLERLLCKMVGEILNLSSLMFHDARSVERGLHNKRDITCSSTFLLFYSMIVSFVIQLH